MASRPTEATPALSCADVAASIRAGNRSGCDIYSMLYKRISRYMMAHVGYQHFEDRTSITLIAVLEAIENGTLRDPNQIVAYALGVARNQVHEHIRAVVRERQTREDIPLDEVLVRQKTQEQEAIRKQRSEIVFRILQSLSARDRHIMRRFYVDEASDREICEEMGLSNCQLRGIKARAKVEFIKRSNRRLGMQVTRFSK